MKREMFKTLLFGMYVQSRLNESIDTKRMFDAVELGVTAYDLLQKHPDWIAGFQKTSNATIEKHLSFSRVNQDFDEGL